MYFKKYSVQRTLNNVKFAEIQPNSNYFLFTQTFNDRF